MPRATIYAGLHQRSKSIFAGTRLWPHRCAVAIGKLPEESDGKFSTRSGILRAIRRPGLYQLDFPVKPAEPTGIPPPGLLESLAVSARYVGRNSFDYFVEVESEEIARGLSPDFKQLAGVKCRGVIVDGAVAIDQSSFCRGSCGCGSR